MKTIGTQYRWMNILNSFGIRHASVFHIEQFSINIHKVLVPNLCNKNWTRKLKKTEQICGPFGWITLPLFFFFFNLWATYVCAELRLRDWYIPLSLLLPICLGFLWYVESRRPSHPAQGLPASVVANSQLVIAPHDLFIITNNGFVSLYPEHR